MQGIAKDAKSHLREKRLNNLPTMPQNSDGSNKSLKQLIGDFTQTKNQVETYENDIRNEFNITKVSD